MKWNIEYGRAKYCSTICHYASRIKIDNNVKCLFCKKSFLARLMSSYKGRQKYCSSICFHNHRKSSHEEVFHSKILKDKSKNGCWLYKTICNVKTHGYGVIRAKGRILLAHRYSWELHYGAIPEGMQILHKCDIRNCVNPKHLFLGTNADNVADKIKKGRSNNAKGSATGMSKLNEDKVLKIKQTLLNMSTLNEYRKLAKKYKVSMVTITKIKYGESWKHVKL